MYMQSTAEVLFADTTRKLYLVEDWAQTDHVTYHILTSDLDF